MDAGQRRILLLVALLAGSLAVRLWYAEHRLNRSRFYDEQFSFRNVTSLVVHQRLKPNNAYYPSLSYLPHSVLLAGSEGLHRTTGIGAFSIFDPGRGDGYSAQGYRVARGVSVLVGTWSLALTYGLGRRLFSPAVGLLGAAFLSAYWAHLRASVVFKPDILVVALTVLTFLWSLDAVARPTRRRFLLAGLAVGLTVAAKPTGGTAALPLAVAGVALAARRRSWGPIGSLALAGGAALATFVALNPHLDQVLDHLVRQRRLYAMRGEAGFFGMVVEHLRWLLEHHGVAIAAGALCGAAALAAAAWRGAPKVTGGRLAAAMLLSFVVGHMALYSASTSLFRGQNSLPMVPFTSLLAAWAGVGLWRLAAGRFPSLGRRAVSAALVAAVVLIGSRASLTYAYLDKVPRTEELVARRLSHLDLPALRDVYLGPLGDLLEPTLGARGWATRAVEDLTRLPPEALDRADAEVLPLALELGEHGTFFRARVAAARETLRIEPGFLKARGPGLMLHLHPWTLAMPPEPVELSPAAEGAWTAGPGAWLQPGEVLSFELAVESEGGARERPTLRLASHELAMAPSGRRRARWLSPRIAWPSGPEPGPLTVVAPGSTATPALRVCRWRRSVQPP